MRVRLRATLATLALLTGTPAFGAADAEPVEYGKVRIAVAEPPARFSAGGERYRIDAENHSDWYDVDAVLTLMNAVLADRGSASRLFVLETDGQFAVVLAATPDALRKAVAADLFALGDPDSAEAAGKAYEEEVLDRLR